MIKVALTGAIGSGKTTVLGFFKKCGAAVASSDAWVHQELVGNVTLRKQLARAFGARVVKNGRVDKRVLAGIAFADASGVKRLNALVHPLVKKRLFGFFRKNRRRRCVVVEVPLLFEAKFERYFDVTIGVATDPRQQRRRLERRGREFFSDARRRMRYQLAGGAKISRCDFCIDNSGSKKKTYQMVKKLMEVVLWKS
jgi:dephospho-CoA kinase